MHLQYRTTSEPRGRQCESNQTAEDEREGTCDKMLYSNTTGLELGRMHCEFFLLFSLSFILDNTKEYAEVDNTKTKCSSEHPSICRTLPLRVLWTFPTRSEVRMHQNQSHKQLLRRNFDLKRFQENSNSGNYIF
jgi:hypothetical protein